MTKEQGMAGPNFKESISPEMEAFLKEQEFESEIQALIDAAREVGIPNFTEQDAIKAWFSEQEYNLLDEQ